MGELNKEINRDSKIHFVKNGTINMNRLRYLFKQETDMTCLPHGIVINTQISQ